MFPKKKEKGKEAKRRQVHAVEHGKDRAIGEMEQRNNWPAG